MMKATKLLTFVIASILFLQTVSAFGVTSSYWDGNPLVMNPGDTKDVTFTLQNMVDEEPISVHVELLEGAPNVELVGKSDYTVAVKTKDIPVVFRVTIPKETPLGTKMKLRASFRSQRETGEQVQLGTGIEKDIDIYAGDVPKPKKQFEVPYKSATSAGIIIIIVFILWILLRRSRKNKSGKAAFPVPDQNARW